MPLDLPDGLDALREHLDLATIMSLIERTAKWADVETFRLLPVWAPELARKSRLYNDNWTTPRSNTNRSSGLVTAKVEGNTAANKALSEALGLRERKNWSCCHIWSVDDPSFQKHNAIVQDHRFFSCIANMVLLPAPLKAFTDVMPDVKAMLRICAYNYYGWRCDHESALSEHARLDAWSAWDAYPKSWPRKRETDEPMGVMHLTDEIRAKAQRRKSRIKRELSNAGAHYPRERVIDALRYWGVSV